MTCAAPPPDSELRSVAAELRAQRDVASVASFYTTHDPAMVARDGRSTYVVAYFKALSDKRLSDDAKLIESRFSAQHDVKLGGDAIANAQVNTQVGNDLAHAELLAFPVIFLLSLLFFRSLVASLLPPLLGGLAIVGTFFLLRVVSTFTDLSVFALNLTTGLGLGLAIDYSLFIVSRYREEAARDGFGVDSAAPHPPDRRTHRAVQLGHGRVLGRRAQRSSRSGSCTRWGSRARSWRCWRRR